MSFPFVNAPVPGTAECPILIEDSDDEFPEEGWRLLESDEESISGSISLGSRDTPPILVPRTPPREINSDDDYAPDSDLEEEDEDDSMELDPNDTIASRIGARNLRRIDYASESDDEGNYPPPVYVPVDPNEGREEDEHAHFHAAFQQALANDHAMEQRNDIYNSALQARLAAEFDLIEEARLSVEAERIKPHEKIPEEHRYCTLCWTNDHAIPIQIWCLGCKYGYCWTCYSKLDDATCAYCSSYLH